jgi:hypothetical protein
MRWDLICASYDNNGASYERAKFLGYNLVGCLFCCVSSCNNIGVGARLVWIRDKKQNVGKLSINLPTFLFGEKNVLCLFCVLF